MCGTSWRWEWMFFGAFDVCLAVLLMQSTIQLSNQPTSGRGSLLNAEALFLDTLQSVSLYRMSSGRVTPLLPSHKKFLTMHRAGP